MYIFLNLRGMGESEQVSCYPLIHSANAYNIWGWVRLKLGAGTVSRSPAWMPGTDYLSHHLLSPRISVSRKLDSGAEPGLKPSHCDVGCRHTNQRFNWWPNAHPYHGIFIMPLSVLVMIGHNVSCYIWFYFNSIE